MNHIFSRWSVADYVVAAVMVAAVIGAGIVGDPRGARSASPPMPSPMPTACDYYPSGHIGRPCVDAKEYERTGRMFWYWHYPDKQAGENWHD